jgi:hypothetical protein
MMNFWWIGAAIREVLAATIGEAHARTHPRFLRPTHLFDTMYLLISFRKSTPPQNRQLIVYYYNIKNQVDGFARDLTFQN